MDYLQALLENTNLPFVSAFVFGLMTAISPCLLATNITATAYIAKNISSKKKVLFSGVMYSLGRAFSHSVIGIILFFGASKFQVSRFFNQNGEKFLGPLLIVLGLIILNVIKLNIGSKLSLKETFSKKFEGKGLWGAFVLGMLFALAFCPYSAALFFGMLIPITISSV